MSGNSSVQENHSMTRSLRDFYETEATYKKFWGSHREIILAENILADLTHDKMKMTKTLEIGIGDGFLMCKMLSLGYEVIGVDIATGRCRNTKGKGQNAEVIVASATALPFKNEAFNRIICSETLEHIPEYTKAIAEAYRVLKTYGRYVVTVPFRQKLVKVLCPHCLRSFYLDGHINSFDEKCLARSLYVAKFDVQRICGFGYNFLYISKICRFKVIRRMLERHIYKILNNPPYMMCIGVKR